MRREYPFEGAVSYTDAKKHGVVGSLSLTDNKACKRLTVRRRNLRRNCGVCAFCQVLWFVFYG
jgi:hypothetical protein